MAAYGIPNSGALPPKAVEVLQKKLIPIVHAHLVAQGFHLRLNVFWYRR